MHGAWYILWWVWSATLIAYLLLYIVAGKRLSGPAKKRGDLTFWVIVVLTVFRMSVRFVLGSGLIYRFAILFLGIAAGFAVLDLARMLAQSRRDDGSAGASDERIQPLKLN